MRRKVRYNKQAPAGVLELVDEVDSKSTAGDSVPVRVRSPAPYRVVIRDFPYDHSIFYVRESSSPTPGGGKPSLALGIKIVYDKLEGRSSLPSSFAMIGGPAHDDTEKSRPAAGADHRLLGLLLLSVRPGPGGDAALCPVCHAVFAGLCAAGHCSVSQAAACKPQDPAVGGPGGAFPYPHLYRRHRGSAVYLHLQCWVHLLPAGGDHTPFGLFAVPEKAGSGGCCCAWLFARWVLGC